MKKIIINLILFIVFLITVLLFTLSTIGIETNRFNKLISDRAIKSKNIFLKLDTIKFKVDIKKLSLFLETQGPELKYEDIFLPTKNIKVYVDFLSLLKSDPKIEKINIVTNEIDIDQINKLSKLIKPSNFKNLLNNKIKEGKLISEIDIFLNQDGMFKDFIVKGTVKDLKIELLKELNLSKINLSFFADKNDVLIKNIFGNLDEIKISDGDIKLSLDSGIKLNSNFNSKINLNKDQFDKYFRYFKKDKSRYEINKLEGVFTNNFSINFDETYKIKKYNYTFNGKIEKSSIELLNPIKNNLISEEIKNIYLSDLQIQSTFSPKKAKIKGDGKYSLNNSDFFKINLENELLKDLFNLRLNFDYAESVTIEIINYKKPNKTLANIVLDIQKNKNNFRINRLIFDQGSNSIRVNDLILKENKFHSFKKIEVETERNSFFIQKDKKILIKGKKFDATNLSKFFVNQKGENKFEKINSNIEIDFKNIKIPMSEKLKNFKLIGEIKKGQFVKISSKGDFGGNNFLDISMKKDKNSDKKYLEIYSDLTRPLLTEYSFFNGLSGGKLLFNSIIDNSKSNSKIKIEKFKLANAPGVIKLLSLADLGGLADLAEGEGLSFDLLEIDMEKKNNFLKLNEILALGPSISVLMEGYQDENGLTSLRGTLVPAKTLNKMISKIPVIGKIVIPKEVGEGLFGISFKMKGPKGKIKTTINPIKTLTPRFIQKIIEKNNKTK